MRSGRVKYELTTVVLWGGVAAASGERNGAWESNKADGAVMLKRVESYFFYINCKTPSKIKY